MKKIRRDRKRKARPSRLDVIGETMVQEVRDLSTADATRKRALLRCEITMLDLEHAELTAKLSGLRQRRNVLEAQVLAITAVIARK